MALAKCYCLIKLVFKHQKIIKTQPAVAITFLIWLIILKIEIFSLVLPQILLIGM